MNEESTKKNERKQGLKKAAVYLGMFLAFAVCLWLIFAPSAKDREKEEEGMGLNADMPDPGKAGLTGDKKTAYEEEELLRSRENRMRSLHDYAFELGGEADKEGGITPPEEKAEAAAPTAPEVKTVTRTGSGSRSQSPFEASGSAYRDINRTLGSFYQAPREDPEKEAMKKELEELRSRMTAEAETGKPSYGEQLALMEKSYEMATRYLPQNSQSRDADTASASLKDEDGGKAKAVPVRQVADRTVSALEAPMTDAEFMEEYSKERNTGFYNGTETEGDSGRNTIAAVVHDSRTVAGGEGIRLRLTEPMMAGKRLVPSGTLLTGTGRINGERLEIRVTSIEHEGQIIPVQLSVYDTDGQKGIFIPGSMEINAVKEIAGNMGQNLGQSISITRQGAGEQLLTDLGRGAIQGTSQYIAGKVREVRVTLKAGYRLFLLSGDSL